MCIKCDSANIKTGFNICRFEKPKMDNKRWCCLSEDHEILHTYRRDSVAKTCRTWRHQLLPVGCTMQWNTVQKYVKHMRPANFKEGLFDLPSPGLGGNRRDTEIGGLDLRLPAHRFPLPPHWHIYGLSLTVFELFSWPQKRFYPTDLDTMTNTDRSRSYYFIKRQW